MAAITREQAAEIKARFEPDVLKMPGVTGVDLGIGSTPTIRVYVDTIATAPSLPTSVEGVPIEVIERRFGLQG